MKSWPVLAAALLSPVWAQDPAPPPEGALLRLVPTRAPGNHGLLDLSWSPDGRLLAAACGCREIHVWGIPSWRELPPFTGHEGGVRSVAFTSGGKSLVSTGSDGMVRVWETAARLPVFSLPGRAAACSPDGLLLAVAAPRENIRLVDLSTGREVLRIKGPGGEFQSLDFSPDGRTLVTGDGTGMVQLWDAVVGAERSRFWIGFRACTQVIWSPDGRALATGTRGRLAYRLWAAPTGDLLFTFPDGNS